MKLVCINNRNKWGTYHSLTIGKCYDVIGDAIKIGGDILVKVVDDDNKEWGYYTTYFINIKKLRKQKLKKIYEIIVQ